MFVRKPICGWGGGKKRGQLNDRFESATETETKRTTVRLHSSHYQNAKNNGYGIERRPIN